jgi:hypothetical protein
MDKTVVRIHWCFAGVGRAFWIRMSVRFLPTFATAGTPGGLSTATSAPWLTSRAG